MKKNIISMVLMMTVTAAMIAGGTMAWFTTSAQAPDAVFTAGTGTVGINVDLLTQGQQLDAGTLINDNWTPGNTAIVSWKVKNTGTEAMVFRIRPNVTVQRVRQDFDYSTLPDIPNPWNGENLLGRINDDGAPEEDWIIETGSDNRNWNDHIYYYAPVVEAGEEVMLSMDITLKGEETSNEYQAASFIIGGVAEAVQAYDNAPFEIWGVDYYSGYTPEEPSDPNTIIAESGSQEDVQAAIGQAQDGNTVLIPAGTWTWTTPASKMPSVSIENKSITLLGAGIDQTIINDQTGTAFHEVPLLIYPSDGKQIRVNGISFVLDAVSSQIGIEIAVPGENWRVDHCSFTGQGHYGRGIKAQGAGVVDHCSFSNLAQGVSVFGEGNQSWAEPLTLGSGNAAFIENCSFLYDDFYDGALDAYNGARYVFRYNLSNTILGHHGLDSGAYRSTFSSEIYENLIIPMRNPPFILSSRGGTGVWFNNRVTGSFSAAAARLRLNNYRSINSYEPWGMCDGNNPIDGNELENGYPSRDQVGRSTDERLWGGVNDLPAPRQALEPHYGWGNTYNDNPIGLLVLPEYQVHIQENRDYYNAPRPGYVPYPYPHPLTLMDYTDEQRTLDLEAAVLENQVELQWQAVANAVTYRIVRDWDQDNAVETYGTSASFDVSGQGTVFMVYALNAEGTVIAAEGKYVTISH